MHKKIIAVCIAIGLVVAIGLALLTQEEDTYARSSNQDFLDDGFWVTNPDAVAIGNALYDNGTNPTAYTQHWQGGWCVGTPTVVQVSPGTIPSPMNTANTVYVLAPWTYTAPATVNVQADCVAILWSWNVQLQAVNIMGNGRNRVIIDNIDISQPVGVGIGFSTNSSNITINNVTIDNATSDGIRLHISQNIHIRNITTHTNQSNGIRLEDITNIFVENIDSYDNGDHGWGWYDVNDFQISNYTLSNNIGMWLDAGDWHSGYVYSGVADGNQIGVLVSNGSTNITVDTFTGYNNVYAVWFFWSDTSYNALKHAVVYSNGSGWVYVAVASGNALEDVYAYDNTDHGIIVHNAVYNTFDHIITQANNRWIEINGDAHTNTFYDVQTINNIQEGIYIDNANYNIFDYIQAHNNTVWLSIFEWQNNYVNNILSYNNSTAWIDISGKWARRNAFNNAALFNNMYGIYLHTLTALDEVRDSVFNNIWLFNNNYGLYMNETNNWTVNENNFNDIAIYNNDRWIYANGANVINNAYHWYIQMFGNSLDLFGTNWSDSVLGAAGSIPSLWWNAGTLTQNFAFTMTCNWAIQATSNLWFNILSYPYCNARWIQPWTWSPDVQYTFFPEVGKQKQPVTYNWLNLELYWSYEPDMFVWDFAYIGSSPFGGHIALDEFNQFTYEQWWFTYRNYPWFDILMTINNSWPANYLITWVNNIVYDWVPASIIWPLTLFPTYTYNPFFLPFQNGLFITRVGYDDAGYESNYYGFIRWLSMNDDISIDKIAHTGAVVVGDHIWFTITVTNNGTGDAGFSQVIDYIPAGIDTGSLLADPLWVYSWDVNAYIWDMPVVSWSTTYVFVLTGTVLPWYTWAIIINTWYFISDQTSNGADWIISDDVSVDVLFPVDWVCWAVVNDTFYGENMVNTSDPLYLCSGWVLTWFAGPNNGIYEWYCDGIYGWSNTYCTVQENWCWDGLLNNDPMAFTYGTASEQCDLWMMNWNGIDGCDNQCMIEIYGCTDPLADNYDWSANVDDGSCYYLWCMDPSAHNYDVSADTDDGSCIFCGDGTFDPQYEQCDDGNLGDSDGCDNQCILESWSCTLTATPSIGLAPLDVAFAFQWSTGFVFDYIDYGTWVTGNSLNYTYTTTGLYTVTAYQWSWDIVSTCSAVVRANQLSCMALGFSVAPTTGTVPFIVTWSYASMPTWYVASSLNWWDGNVVSNPFIGTDYTHMYTNTGLYTAQLHVQNSQYSWFDLYCPIWIWASACGDTGTIDIDTLEISVEKSVQNENQTIFPNGLVPYTIQVTNTSTQARLDNVTIIDLISDNMTIGSYFFSYNNVIYSDVVNDGYFVIDDTTFAPLTISLNPGESIEIIVYATIDPQLWIQWNNYAFAGWNRVPLNWETFCSSSGTATPTCARNPNSQVVQDISSWSSFTALNGAFNPNNFTVCAETEQWAPTTAGLGMPLDPSIVVQKTLIDQYGNPLSGAVAREDTTFLLDLTFTNMYPHTIDWNSFSLTDYFSGGIGISWWNIVDIQTISGVSVPRTTWSNEYSIDISGLYAPNVYTPVCQDFTRNTGDHIPGCWTGVWFDAPQTSYATCLPAAAINSWYAYIQKYTVTGAWLDGIQFYPWINDQWFGGSAVWSFFETYPHTVTLCQTNPSWVVIDQIDSLQLVVTTNITDPLLSEQNPLCNEVSVSYAGTGNIDDACFDLTIPQYCTLMLQPDFVIAGYDTVPYISWGYVNGSILSDMTLTSTTTSVNPIVDYQWSIYSSWDFLWMWLSPYVFDNNLIISGQGTPSIDLNFSQYVFDGNRPFIRVSLTVTDSMWYQATYETPLFRDHDQWWLYWIAGNVVTWSTVTWYDFNMTGEMLSSSTDSNIIPTNQLYFPDIWPIPNLIGIDRYNIWSNDEFFPYTGPYNYTNTYTPWIHIINLNTHIGDINQNYMIGHRTYPIACSVACGNEAIEWTEQCDDGNTDDADGCSSYCQIESWRQCTGQPSVCTPIPPYCGDGVNNQPNEQCDDGNQDDYDGCTTQCQPTSPQCQMVILHTIDPIINYVWAYPIWTGSTGMLLTFNTPTVSDGYSYQWSVSWLDLTAVYGMQFSWSSTWTQTQVFISSDVIQWSYSFPDFSFQVGLEIGNGLMTGYVDGIVSCTKNGACWFTTYSYNFATGNVQWFTVNGNYNFVTYMQSISTTTPPTADSLTWVIIQNGWSTYYLAIYNTGTYLRYTSPSNWSWYTLDSWATYDTIPFQLSGGWISFNNSIATSYYNTCLGWSYCGDGILNPNDNEVCDLWPDNGQPNSWCSNYCQTASVNCTIIWFPLWGNTPLTINLVMNPWLPGSYFDYGNGTTGTLPIYTYTTGGVFNIVWYTPHPTVTWTMVACPLVSQITVSGQCGNGATNYPMCNTCGTGQYYCAASQQCIATGWICAWCTNGATNYPTCNACGTGQTYCGTTQQCIASGSVCGLCSNGATNPPTCDLCWLGQSYCAASQQCITTGWTCAWCTNGATNYPTCNQCGTGSFYCGASQQCVTNGWVCAWCTNGAVNYPTCNACGTGQYYCSTSNSCKNNGQSCGGWGWGGWWATPDNCPQGDFSASYYDRQCGSAPVHGSAPVGKFCIYDDEEYLARGSFDDIIGHRWELPIEVMRVSCLHRGRHTKAGLRRYEPNGNIQRDEVLKTLVKIVGIEFEDFTIKSEELLYTGVIPFADVAYNNRFSHYASYAFGKWLTEWLYTTDVSKKYLSPTVWMTRYEATKAIVIAYEKIYGPILTQGTSISKIIDVSSTDPYYTYVRKAEIAWLVQGYLQTNGSSLFKGQWYITRAEFAKIIAAAFNAQLIDIDEVVVTSSAYAMIVESIQKTKGDKLIFVRSLFEKMKRIDDDVFLRKFKIQKDVFIKALADKILLPMLKQ